jgi:hypothetical protein
MWARSDPEWYARGDELLLAEAAAGYLSAPDEDQEALAEAAREIEALRTGLYAMSSDEEAAVAEGLAQAKRGQFASGDGIAELWKRAGS